MTTTDKQSAANRANAQLSTGPKTSEGKQASSQNAARHGLTSKNLILLPGQQADFFELADGLRSKLIPDGPLEETIFKRILECAWQLERCRQASALLFKNNGIDPLTRGIDDVHYERIQRYAKEAENSMYKAMRELGKIQSETQFRHEICPLNAEQETDAAYLATAPHAMSQVCMLTQIIKHVIAFNNQPKKFAWNPAQHESRIEAILNQDPREPQPQQSTVMLEPIAHVTAAAA